MSNYKSLIDKLALSRMKQERTLLEVAVDLGIHKTTLFYWESHKSKPRYDQFLEWIEVLDLKVKDVLDEG